MTYDDLGRPLKWTPIEPFEPVSLVYDRYGLLQEWTWGGLKEDYNYDRAGRFQGITFADGNEIVYSYKDIDNTKVSHLLLQYNDRNLLTRFYFISPTKCL